MTFRRIGRDELTEAFRGKRVAVVGSGPGSLENPVGFVDSHDVVVRVNNYKLIPGSGTGMRTDAHFSFYGSSIKKTAAELKADGVRLCIAKCPDAQVLDSPWHQRNRKMAGVDYRYIYKARERWWFCDTYVPSVAEFMESFELLGRHVPTTGFAAVLQVLACDPQNCFITGLDFFQSGLHNVNEVWRSGDPADPIGHVPDAERAWFAENVERLPVTMDAMLAGALVKNVKQLAQPIPHYRRKALKRKLA